MRSNQYKLVDWSIVSWDELPKYRRRQRLLEEANFCCSQCGYNKTRDDGATILEIDHIDGDHLNNEKSNLRVLCPNCHALTPNFRNWGRKGSNKTSTRFRRENFGFAEHIAKIHEESRLKREQDNNEFVETIRKLHSEKTIDFQAAGWGAKLDALLGKKRCRKRLIKLAPEFVRNHCFMR